MPSRLHRHHVGFFTIILFRREQRRQSLSVIVAISRGNGAIGDEKRENDMEREYQIETTELKDEELEAVNGGAINFGSGFGKLGVALNAAQGGSKAAALYWLIAG
ncbi:bacteriocin class II family protein [Bradyrhizobium sp. JYMT SZCCT0428]|uniref:bacteriocin class II family protein n=1 Tax=Bradyrhizobium sp. JYMT SZCCT0428 TaxID=2807673 RepID=UPI001BA5BD38|nr:bacteriocin class II family protein [Bradyrhizobium sp. JYMT SZCCT0428]MBR1151650.1 class IIb bacteriocin, lactobin A/cerein 7B family [Bradyrhizobium sp. JYMT SZCCT0428]